MADLQNEVWVENTIEDMRAGAAPRREATNVEANAILTRRMLDARCANKGEDSKAEDDALDFLDDVWSKMTPEEEKEARTASSSILDTYLVAYDEKDVYRDKYRVLRYKATDKMVEHTWDV